MEQAQMKCINKKLRSSTSGLTIVELMLALTLMSIVLAIGYNFFFLNYRAYQRGEELSMAQFDVRLASDFVTSELRNVTEVSVTDTTLDHQIDATLLSNRFERVQSVSFNITQQGSSFIVIYEISGLVRDPDELYTLQSKVLLNNINSATTNESPASFIYYN
jgi:prepilin-type N-terminal cleavage/methylation domain-containing protein